MTPPVRELCRLVIYSAVLMFAVSVVLSFAPVLAVSPLRPLIVVACALPAPFLAARSAGRDPREVLGPSRRVRWPVLWRALVVSLVVFGSLAAWRFASTVVHPQLGAPLLLVLLGVLVLVPLQAAAEEAIFRGSLPQILGAWVRSPWVSFGVPVMLFSLLHFGVWEALLFGACAAFLAWSSAGLEAPFALHVGANLAFFLPLVAGAPAHLGPDWLFTLFATAGIWAWVRHSRRFR